MSLRGGAKRRRRNPVVNAICHGIATLTPFARDDRIIYDLLFSNMNLFLFIFIIIIGLALFSVAWACMSLAPFVPMRTNDLKRIFKLADLQPGETFYDLGCGNGKVAIYAARNYKVKAKGIEFAWPIWLLAKINQFFKGNKNLKIKFGNLFKQDLSQADVVYFFGMPDSVKKRLKEKLERELKPAARVVSYVFAVPGWQPAMVDKPSDKDVTIYLYQR